MKHTPCSPELLSAGSIARVELCANCRVVSVHVGATTLRFDESACESLWTTLGDALVEIHRLSASEKAPAQTTGRSSSQQRFHSS